MTDKDILNSEINLIQDEEKRKIVKDLIGKLPDYFFEIPASSTGKYHPKYAQGEGGLIKHTKATVKIAESLLELEMFSGLSKIKDDIIAALILHDGLKHGYEGGKYGVSEHPNLMANFIINELQGSEFAYTLAQLIETHMGQWNTDYKTKEVILKKPSSKPQAFVHLCDYIASRRFIEVELS